MAVDIVLNDILWVLFIIDIVSERLFCFSAQQLHRLFGDFVYTQDTLQAASNQEATSHEV